MTDVVVTLPFSAWNRWVAEGDLPSDTWSGMDSHFWVRQVPNKITIGSRVYINAGHVIRGYAPLVGVERACTLDPTKACLVRRDGAQAVTLMCHGSIEGVEQTCYGEPAWCAARTRELGCPHPAYLQSFRGYRYRWWGLEHEQPFPGWRNHIERP